VNNNNNNINNNHNANNGLMLVNPSTMNTTNMSNLNTNQPSFVPRSHQQPPRGHHHNNNHHHHQTPKVNSFDADSVDTAQLHFSFISKQHVHLVTEATIRDVFAHFGHVQDVSIKKTSIDQKNGEQTGYGFLHYPLTEEGIESAVKAAKIVRQVHINHVLYDCRLTWSLEEIIHRRTLGLPQQMKRSPSSSPPSTDSPNLSGNKTIALQQAYYSPSQQPQANNNNFGGYSTASSVFPPSEPIPNMFFQPSNSSPYAMDGRYSMKPVQYNNIDNSYQFNVHQNYLEQPHNGGLYPANNGDNYLSVFRQPAVSSQQSRPSPDSVDKFPEFKL
jgi:hypothetical protein